MTELRKVTREDTRAEREPDVSEEDRRQRILRQKMRVHPRPAVKVREEKKGAAAA